MQPQTCSPICFWVMVLLMFAQGLPDLYAADRYVALGNATPQAPYTNWVTAATNIQDAIDAADAGETIFVSNGVYQTGGRAVSGSVITNRVVIDKPVLVQSVNGPGVTSIRGNGPNGASAVRCVWMTNGATLVGFTLTNGATRSSAGNVVIDRSGGGVWANSLTAFISNCVLAGNSADQFGGGAYFGTLNNCILTSNTGDRGGGAHLSVLTNCTLTGNASDMDGGGAALSTLFNCILTDNTADSEGGGASYSTLINCVLTGNAAQTGGGAAQSTLKNCTLTGNAASFLGGGAVGGTLHNCTVVDNSAAFQGGGTENSALYNCIVYFNSAPVNNDYSGDFVTYSHTCTTPLPAGAGNITNAPVFINAAFGNYRLAATSPGIDAGTNDFEVTASDLDGNPRIENGIVDMGAYEFQLASTATTHYVAIHNPEPLWPYVTWETAATNIQDALDAASAGDTILVSNGIYQTGGRAVPGSLLTNRVVVDKPVTVQSINGAEYTMVAGAQVGGVTNGNAAVRGIWLYSGSKLEGFTISNGATRAAGDNISEQSGGGIYAVGTTTVIRSCIVVGNAAAYNGGGIHGGTVYESRMSNNRALGGGGAFSSDLNNCLVIDNIAANGGGLYSGTVSNSTIAGNHASVEGGGTFESDVINAIVYLNTASTNANYAGGTFNYTCTIPLPPGLGIGNITNDPVFVNAASGNYALGSGSPCINRGNTSVITATNDISGNPRIAFYMVDMGAYEYQIASPTGIIHYVRENHEGWVFPYTSWETAAPTIQMAVDAASAGSTVLVTNGVYNKGGRIAHDGVITNRVLIDKAILVESVTGPVNTMIHGSGPLGLSAVRGVWMTNGASISGFAISEGHTSSNQFVNGRNGGGLWAQSGSVTISNCFFTANRAFKFGGAVYGGTVHHSSFNLNVAEEGGAAYTSTLWNCSFVENAADYGGAARLSTLYYAVVVQNTASVLGGGLSGGMAENCFILENHSDFFGGGIHAGTIVNCTVVSNSAANNYGGSYLSNHRNSILYHNTSPASPNHADSSTFINTCTYPLPAGAIQSFTNDPQLVSIGSGVLSAGSPCRDTGDAGLITQAFDRLGNPRVVNGYVDIGAHEFQGVGQGDYDGDGMGNGDERIAGTDFTDVNQVFEVTELESAGVSFNSVTGRLYAVEYNENLLPNPQLWIEFTNNISGTGGPLVITDPLPGTTRNYRVWVKLAP